MKKTLVSIIFFLLGIALFAACQTPQKKENQKETEIKEEKKFKIQFLHDTTAKSINVSIDGKPFTSYLYTDTLLKTVLFPLRTPLGTIITRGYPIAPRPFEYIDHPHHVGHWFSYGSVNEIDFWNNSFAIPQEEKMKYGIIKHQKITKLVNSDTRGELGVELDWVTYDSVTLLIENSLFTFGVLDSNTWYFDRAVQLYAPNGDVRLFDSKEGMFALRVAHELEHPTQRPEFALDKDGKPTSKPVIFNENVTGKYRNSNGIEGEAAWGKRANWLKLTGKIGQENISIAILNNKQNIAGVPFWHARGYGLFAVNNLGHRIFTEGKENYGYILTKDGTVTFRYRMLINSHTGLSDEMLNQQFESFSNSVN